MPTPIANIKMKTSTEVVDVPIYFIEDVLDSSLRIQTNGMVGAFDLVNISPSLPLRVMTTDGIKSVNTVSNAVPATIVTNGLIRYWHFNQGVTANSWLNLAPSTRGNSTYDGVIYGATLGANGVLFDGVNDYATFMPTGTIIPFTLEWIYQYVSQVGGVTSHVIGNETISRFRTINNRISVQNGGVFLKTPVLTAGTFYHMAYTFDPVTMQDQFFVDGVLTDTTTAAANFNLGNPTLPFSIAAVQDGTAALHSIFKMVRLYDRVLTQEEIQFNYANGSAVGL